MKYLTMIGSIFFIDLTIKNEIERRDELEKGERKIGRWLLVRRHHNKGMALNLGDRVPGVVAVLSLLLTFAALCLLIVTLGQKGNMLLRMGLTLLLGGAFSNTYDRITRKYVVDYISFNVPMKWLRRIVFNIADFSIILGSLIVVMSGIKKN